jgi:hypothetical protein
LFEDLFLYTEAGTEGASWHRDRPTASTTHPRTLLFDSCTPATHRRSPDRLARVEHLLSAGRRYERRCGLLADGLASLPDDAGR